MVIVLFMPVFTNLDKNLKPDQTIHKYRYCCGIFVWAYENNMLSKRFSVSKFWIKYYIMDKIQKRIVFVLVCVTWNLMPLKFVEAIVVQFEIWMEYELIKLIQTLILDTSNIQLYFIILITHLKNMVLIR